MNGKIKINIYLIAAILLILVLANQQGLISLNSLAVIPLNTEDVYLNPVFGKLTCELADPRTLPVTIQNTTDWFLIKVYKSTLESASCTEEVGQAGCDYVITGQENCYPVYTANVEVRARNKLTGKCDGTGGDYSYKSSVSDCGATIILSGMTQGEQVQWHANQNTEVEFKSICYYTATKTIRPYWLVYEGGTGLSYVWNANGCRAVKDQAGTIAAKIDASQLCIGDTTGTYCALYEDQILPGHWINFLEGYALQAVEFAPTLNGQQVSCVAGSIYPIGEITLKSGTVYKIADTNPSKILGTYGVGQTRECCPGMTSPGQVCSNDWKWVSTGTANTPCTTHAQCYIGSVGGSWSIDYNDPNEKTLVRGACVNGFCNYTYESKVVECTSNAQCGGTTPICDVGATWKCIASTGGTGGDTTPPGAENYCDDLLKVPVIGPFLAQLCNQMGFITFCIFLIIIILIVFAFLRKPGSGGASNIYVIR